MQVFFALHDTFLFDEMAAFREVLTAGDRREALLARSRGARRACAPRSRDTDGRALRVHLGRGEGGPRRRRTPSGSAARSPTCARDWGSDPLDTFLDASLAEHLTHDVHARRLARRQVTRRRPRQVVAPSRQPAREQRRRRAPHQLLRGRLLDAAAQPSTCPTSSRSRTRCAVSPRSPRSCTASPTAASSRAGSAADLVVWDPSRLGVGATRWADDFPAGGGRFVVDADGLPRAGRQRRGASVDDGVDTGARAGEVLRPTSLSWSRGGRDDNPPEHLAR